MLIAQDRKGRWGREFRAGHEGREKEWYIIIKEQGHGIIWRIKKKKKAWKIGQKLNYSEFKHINLMGPMERVIKLKEATQDSEEQKTFL